MVIAEPVKSNHSAVESAQQLADSMNDLEIVAQISTVIASIRDTDELLQTVSDLTKKYFNLYHAHIYLLDPTGAVLRLAGGAGSAGLEMKAAKHRIALKAQQSLVARAARTREGVTVNDVMAEFGFLPNPLLPETRAELSTPLIFRDEVIGVLDVQSQEVGRFDADDLRIFTILAAQVAVAVENSRAFERVSDLLKAQEAEQQQKDLLVAIGNTLLAAENEIDLLKATALIDPDPRLTIALAYLDMESPGVGAISVAALRFKEQYSTGGPFAGSYSITESPLTQIWLATPDLPIFVEDLMDSPLVTASGRQVFTRLGAHGMALVPLRAGEQWEGLWFAFWPEPHTFSEVEKLRLTSLGQILASAVKIRRTYLQVQAAEKAASQRYAFGKQLNESRTAQNLVTAIAENMPVRPTAGVVFLEWDNDDHETAIGFTIRGFWRSPTNNIQLANTWSRDTFPNFDKLDPTNLIWSDDMAADSLISEAEQKTYASLNVRARLILPLIRNGKWFGNVTAYWAEPHHQTTEELDWWRSVADQISTAFNRTVLEMQALQRARDMETVAEVSAAITSIRNLDDLLQQVSDLTKQRFDLYHAHIYLLNVEADRLRLAAGAGEAGQLMKASGHSIDRKATRSLVARAARTGQAVLINDIMQEDGFLPNPLLPDTRAELAIPLILGDRVLGILDVQSTIPGAFNERSVQVMSTLAGQIAIAIENARAFDQAQGLIAYNQTIISSVPDGLMITDPKTGKVIDHNPQIARMLGYATDEFYDINFFALTPPEWVEATRLALAQAAVVNVPISIEKEYFRKDGGRLPIRLSAAYFSDALTHETRAITIISDLTAQRAEQQRRELIAQISAALLNANSEVDILKSISSMTPNPVAELHLGYFEGMRTGTSEQLTIVAIRKDGQFMPTREPLAADHQEGLVSTFQHLLNQAFFINDTQVVPEEGRPFGEFAAQRGIRSAAIIPLRTNEQWLGILFVFWPDVHPFSESEKDLFNAVSQLLVSGVATRRAYLAEQEAEQESSRLFQLNTAITLAENEAEILEAILSHAAPAGVNAGQMIVWENGRPAAGQMIQIVAHHPAPGQADQSETSRFVDTFPMLTRLDKTQVVWSNDVQSDVLLDPVTLAAFDQSGIRSAAFIPLTIRNVPTGTVILSSDQPYQHTERDIRIYQATMGQASTALERLFLQLQAEQRVLELETVAQVTTAAASLLNTTDLLQTVADLTKEQFDLYHAHVYLIDEESHYLMMTAGAGQVGQAMKAAGHRIPLSRERSLVAQAARTRKGVIVDDVTREPNFMPNPLLPQTRSELAVPLLIGDRMLGVLDAQSDQVARFSANDIFVFTTMADQISIAVQNARLYEEQARTAEQLREVDQLKSEFMASMSHELRTPLNSIIGFSEVLADGLDGELPDEAKIDVDAIHESGQHLLELINDVLDLAKIEAGHVELDLESMVLDDLVDEVLRSSRILLKEKPVALEASIPANLPLVKADVKRLRQILKNLVSNAIKFTEQGEISVNAQAIENGRLIQIDVNDSGVGIAPEHQKLIFERFRQVDNSLTRRVGGTGLGLPITRELVEMHGGKIWISSSVGRGSTFSFTIPAAVLSTERA